MWKRFAKPEEQYSKRWRVLLVRFIWLPPDQHVCPGVEPRKPWPIGRCSRALIRCSGSGAHTKTQRHVTIVCPQAGPALVRVSSFAAGRRALSSLAVFVVGDRVSCTITMLVKSVHTTRLVTRAKEFHYCASTRVSQTLMRNESEGACWRAEMGSRKAAPSADPDSLMKDLSESVTVETRKMVIYA